jgi:hypothetical protein
MLPCVPNLTPRTAQQQPVRHLQAHPCITTANPAWQTFWSKQARQASITAANQLSTLILSRLPPSVSCDFEHQASLRTIYMRAVRASYDSTPCLRRPITLETIRIPRAASRLLPRAIRQPIGTFYMRVTFGQKTCLPLMHLD